MEENIKNLLHKLSQNDDQKVFRLFFYHYYARLIKFSLLFVPFHDQAEEVVSEVMIKLLGQRDKLYKIENFEGYLFLAVKNQAISFQRKQKKYNNHISLNTEQDNILDKDDPEKSFEYNELYIFLNDVLNHLPPRRQMIYKLVKEENHKIKEVAALLDIAPKTVENHLDMAIKEIRSKISEYLREKPSASPLIKITKVISIVILFLFFF
jgi:RNA polymerase sigma-70 factor (ECF subfamily)